MEKNKLIPKNPATLENYPALPILKGDEVAERVHQAKQASRAWANLSFKERGRYLLKAREYLLDHLDEIARTISEDNGKPLVESLTSDILTVCDSFTYYSKHAEKILKDEKLNIGIMEWLGRSSKIHYQPLGVVAIISPWNFPFS
ncbi:MAG: aldehyde dehydrogenase family protein, partial [Deltaproteobacteria bacterium]|nr:aldehyde dehydrogenase family protein [Deltaproteobacteria bacterium]